MIMLRQDSRLFNLFLFCCSLFLCVCYEVSWYNESGRHACTIHYQRRLGITAGLLESLSRVGNTVRNSFASMSTGHGDGWSTHHWNSDERRAEDYWGTEESGDSDIKGKGTLEKGAPSKAAPGAASHAKGAQAGKGPCCSETERKGNGSTEGDFKGEARQETEKAGGAFSKTARDSDSMTSRGPWELYTGLVANADKQVDLTVQATSINSRL